MKKLEDYKWDAWNCYHDSMCKFVFSWHIKSGDNVRMCPSILKYKFDAFAAQGRMDIARAMIEGDLDIKESERLLDIVYNCQLCGACDYVCGRIKEINPGKVIQAMRAKLVADGVTPPPEFKKLMDTVRENQSPYEKPAAARTDWISKMKADDSIDDMTVSEDAKTENLLFVGCSPLRDPAAEKMPQNVLTLLAKADFNVGILGEKEKCCGNPSLRIGDADEFVSFAKENIQMFNKMGIKKLICLCPYCYSTMRRDYPEVGEAMNFEVVHIIEVVADLLEQGKLKPTKNLDMTVTYHDPCHLGRISGNGTAGTNAFSPLYEAPRRILNTLPGVKLIEMDRCRDATLCCGGGSWMKTGNPEFAQETALIRIDEAKSTGSSALVTNCPHCEENFEDALKADEESMELYNLLDLVVRSL